MTTLPSVLDSRSHTVSGKAAPRLAELVSDAVALVSLANWMMLAALSPAAAVLRPE